MSRKKKGSGKSRKEAAQKASTALFDRRAFARRFTRNVVWLLLPVALVWLLITPGYNRFLTRATENLVRLSESPNATRLAFHDKHYFLVTRSDVPSPQGHLSSVRVTDVHFLLILTGAFFLAVPKIGWQRRWESLGWAFLISVFFHIILLFFWVKFIYATQLGSWSASNYNTFEQNFWGLSKHLLDLPFKFALPLILWSYFYLRLLMSEK